MPKKLNINHAQEEFNKRGYTLLDDIYINSKHEMKYICNLHPNSTQDMSLNNLKSGSVCLLCKKENIKIRSENRKINLDYIKKYIQTNSKCILVSKSYENSREKLELKCKCEEHFHCPWHDLKNKKHIQCQKCAIESRANKRRLPFEMVKNTIENKSGCELLSKPNEYKNTYSTLKIKCSCGNPFDVMFDVFKQGKQKCDLCIPKSKGELRIENYLKKNNIEYQKQYKVKECVNKRMLPFDFQIEKQNTSLLIEYDGKQHFQHINIWQGLDGLNERKQNDTLKNRYAIQQDQKLIRIPYWEFENIEYILDNVLNYFDENFIKQDININLVHRYLVNHPDWSHEKYIEQQNTYCNEMVFS